MRDGITAKRRMVLGAGVAAVISVLYSVGAPAAHADAPLSAVQNLVATVTGDVATVSWSPPADGTVARYQVQALLGEDESDYGTRITSGTSIQWDQMPFGDPVTFQVTPIGPDGAGYESGPAGPMNETGTVTAADTYCPPGSTDDCVVVDSLESLGPETHPGSGLLDDPEGPGNQYASMLDLTHWRVDAGDPGANSDASSYVPSTGLIEVLSDAWYSDHHYTTLGRTYAIDPWLDWNLYTTFIQSTVQSALAQGEHPYWEIQNEPENYPYSPIEAANRDRVEQQYLEAYDAIKAVDPTANVIGPSIDWMYQSTSSGWYIDMKSFIPFAAANGMKLAAVAWHDNAAQTDSDPLNYLETPDSIRDHAAEVRELIAENPGIGSPVLMVDENSSAAGQFIPGWEAGYLAEEDRAGVTYAERACWPYPAQSSGDGACSGPYLDELLNQDLLPSASFWTMVDYAAMTGSRMWSATTDPNLSSLAVTDTTGTTRILLGRHATCSGWTVTTEYCAETSPAPAVPTTVNVLVPSGASSATATVQEIPDTRNDLPNPPAATSTTVAVTGGLASVTIPRFLDGEAYFLTLTPNSASGSAPSDGQLTATQVPPASGASVPTRMLVEAGDYQSAAMLHTYGSPMSILATDQYGNALADQEVTFALPSGHAVFSNGQIVAKVDTNAVGIATSPPIRALEPGGFTSFSYLTNVGTGPSAPAAYFAFLVTA